MKCHKNCSILNTGKTVSKQHASVFSFLLKVYPHSITHLCSALSVTLDLLVLIVSALQFLLTVTKNGQILTRSNFERTMLDLHPLKQWLMITFGYFINGHSPSNDIHNSGCNAGW